MRLPSQASSNRTYRNLRPANRSRRKTCINAWSRRSASTPTSWWRRSIQLTGSAPGDRSDPQASAAARLRNAIHHTPLAVRGTRDVDFRRRLFGTDADGSRRRGDAATYYTYQSSGVILPGESLDVFSGVDDELDRHAPDYADRVRQRDALIARVDEKIRYTSDVRGPTFTETVPEGRRVWRLVETSEVRVPGRLSWAFAPGLALIFGGLGCFFISWRRP
jgi:hypothetical protein